MTNNIVIRKMTLDDLEMIKDVLISDFDEFWSYTILKNELCSDNSLYFVAVKNNDIIGFAGIKIILDEAEIMNIVVHKNYRKLGIGSLLLENLIFESNKHDVKVVHLEVNSNNVAGIKLYEKYHFEKDGVRKGYYKTSDSINNDAILMSLHI